MRRRLCALATVVTVLGVLAACGSSPEKSTGPATLTWYVGPDRVDTAALAKSCSASSGGDFRITVRQLPADVATRDAQLVRRFLAKDDSIDLLSLDTASTAEFAAAGFLAPVPTSLAPTLSAGIAPAALAAATYDKKLVVAPWIMDPQLLWFRGNLAERAGLDTTKPISWVNLVEGARRLRVTLQIEDRNGNGLAELVNSLVVDAGGDLVNGAGRTASVGLDTTAGRTAASVVALLRDSGVSPGPSEDALTSFAAANGGFLVGSSSVRSDPALAAIAGDLGWTAYPVVGTTSIAPLAGVGLAVPREAPRAALSFKAISCLTSPGVMSGITSITGHGASRLATYDEPTVLTAVPRAAELKLAVQSGRTVPVTPYWQLAVAAINDTWQPVATVNAAVTPEKSQIAVRAAIAGKLP